MDRGTPEPSESKASKSATPFLSRGEQERLDDVEPFVPLRDKALEASRKNGSENPVNCKGPVLQREILLLIRERPGLNIEELCEYSGLSRGSTRYHIETLVEGKRVVKRRQGNHVLHFDRDMPEVERQAISLMRLGSVRSLVEALMEDPIIDVQKFARKHGLVRRSARRSIRMLVGTGLAVEQPSQGLGRGVRVIRLHREIRIAWVFWIKKAGRNEHPGPLWAAPGWLLGVEMAVVQWLSGLFNNA